MERLPVSAVLAVLLAVSFVVSVPAPCRAQTGPAVPLDSVAAVVNGQAILSSDIDDDVQLSVLDPAQGGMTLQRALDELISRALIQQQIRREDLPAIQPTAAEVTARVEEIRKQLPACVRADCSTDAGWKAFLAAHQLTQYRVEAYLRNRMQVLRFIEERFRQGIQISDQQIESYYHDTLLPQYPAGASVPPLNQVSSRIEEILLEQQVNELFDSWLDNLRSQGDVEILDPSLEPAAPAPGRGDGSE
jgi:peptidyl-prolyl cis-trans isomerase SurA